MGIILLSGTLPEIVIGDPLKLKKKTFAGRTVEIEFGSLTEDANNKGHYSLDLTAKRLGVVENNQNDDFNWSNSIWQKIELVDDAGNRYQSFYSNNQNNNGTSVPLTIPFGPENRRGVAATKLGPPVKVLVNEWLSVTNEVTFEFKNIPLPVTLPILIAVAEHAVEVAHSQTHGQLTKLRGVFIRGVVEVFRFRDQGQHLPPADAQPVQRPTKGFQALA